ncbi:MAG TPA: hypothetical protein HA257_01315 [Candidatus Methanoperedenaceae archaeon]|nr:hypothetical protein [Candidatus Methanoperedenaceae archaeon]
MRKVIVLVLVAVAVASSLGCTGKVKTYDTMPERLSVGSPVTIEGVNFTVERYELRDTFSGNHDLNIFYSAQGYKFLYVFVRAVNSADARVEIPSQYDVSIRYAGRPFRPEVNYISQELPMYEFNEFEEQPVAPGHVRDGWVLFEVPADINTSNVSVVVEFPHTSYTRIAIWSLA